MHNGLVFELLKWLHLEVVYRCYPNSSSIRRMVDTRQYWINLIKRDLGFLPSFIDATIDVKRYYLRVRHYPIGLKLRHWITHDKINYQFELVTKERVISQVGEVTQYENGTIEFNHQRLFPPQAIKCIRKIHERYYLIAYSGQVYRLQSIDDRLVMIVMVEKLPVLVNELGAIEYLPNRLLIVSRSGRVVIAKLNECDQIQSYEFINNINQRIIQLEGATMLGEGGTIYEIINPISNFTETKIRLTPRPGRTIISRSFPIQDNFLLMDNNEVYSLLFNRSINGYLTTVSDGIYLGWTNKYSFNRPEILSLLPIEYRDDYLRCLY